ncbi:membrane protein [Bacteroidia bacterium]|nr:membrane protein [Bacteroidia bacterium]
MRISKKLALSAAVIIFSSSVFAGGLLTNTNQNVHFLRNPSRDASYRIDAVYSNPAALIKLPDGFSFSLNNQSAFQTRTVTAAYPLFVMNGGSETKAYEGTAKALFIPSLQAVYNTGKWAFSANIAVVGGGGSLEYKNGLPSFETQVSVLPVMANQLAASINPALSNVVSQYGLDQYLKGSSVTYGVQLGATYKINEMFSAFAGARLAIANNAYEGYLKNISINPNVPMTPFNGSMVKASDFLNGLVAAGFVPAAQVAPFLTQVADKEINCSQSGLGIAPILGLNVSYEKLNIGLKYEFQTNVELKNSTKKDDTGLFPDGAKTNADIPALLTAGVSYKITDNLEASVGYHHYFDKSAKMKESAQKLLSGNTNEFSAGLEYRINKTFLVSGGAQLTRHGLSDEYLTDMNYTTNSYSVGIGGEVTLTKNLKLNVGYLLSQFSDYKEKETLLNGQPVNLTYARTSHCFGIGLDFAF